MISDKNIRAVADVIYFAKLKNYEITIISKDMPEEKDTIGSWYMVNWVVLRTSFNSLTLFIHLDRADI